MYTETGEGANKNRYPKVCHGKACIKGTRIFFSVVLDCLAEGMKEKEILKEYPSLKREHIQASLQYGAILASEELLSVSNSRGQTSEI